MKATTISYTYGKRIVEPQELIKWNEPCSNEQFTLKKSNGQARESKRRPMGLFDVGGGQPREDKGPEPTLQLPYGAQKACFHPMV